eukprot:4864043-Pleurochrysis_carterae.AAC.1
MFVHPPKSRLLSTHASSRRAFLSLSLPRSFPPCLLPPRTLRECPPSSVLAGTYAPVRHLLPLPPDVRPLAIAPFESAVIGLGAAGDA